MSVPTKQNVVDHWLEAEAAEAPECRVVAALRTCTKSMKLDEGAAITKLRELYEEPPPLPENVQGKSD